MVCDEGRAAIPELEGLSPLFSAPALEVKYPTPVLEQLGSKDKSR